MIGDIAGAPGKLPCTADVNRDMRMLEKASPRVRVFSIGKSEEAREMISMAVTSEANMAKMEENRACIVMRFADARDLQISGLVEGGSDIAQRPAVVDVPVGDGHVVLVSNNPVRRGETRRSYFLGLCAILNTNSLDAGRQLNAKQPCRSGMH